MAQAIGNSIWYGPLVQRSDRRQAMHRMCSRRKKRRCGDKTDRLWRDRLRNGLPVGKRQFPY